MTRSIVIAGGGTGGHVYPGLALAEAIVAADPQARVTFVGAARGIETRVVPAAGFPLELIDVVPYARSLGARRFLAPAIAARATARARGLLKRLRADVVASMGGYASLPVALAARSRGIPIVLHEQNAIPGRANLLVGRLTRTIAVTFAESVAAFPRRATVRVVGNPLRASIATLDRAAKREHAVAELGLDPARKTLLVFGGSQGAARLNEAARGVAERWRNREDRQIVLIAGRGKAAVSQPPVLHEHEYVDRMELAYAAADCAVYRSGAGVMELACVGLPSVLVPYPHARDDHQTANAKSFVRAGAAVLVGDADADAERIEAETDRILSDDALAKAMSDAARALSRPRAAHELAMWTLEVARR